MVCYSDQSIFRPAVKPIHGAAADEAWELQRSVSELLANLFIVFIMLLVFKLTNIS